MLPMITLAPEQPDMRLRDYSNIQLPRQEIGGPAYQDRTQSSPATELLTKAHYAADHNKQMNAQQDKDYIYIQRRWKQPYETPVLGISQLSGTNDGLHTDQALTQSYPQPEEQHNKISQSPLRGIPIVKQDSVSCISDDETEDEMNKSVSSEDSQFANRSILLTRILSPSKKAVVDGVMKVFWKIFQNEFETSR